MSHVGQCVDIRTVSVNHKLCKVFKAFSISWSYCSIVCGVKLQIAHLYFAQHRINANFINTLVVVILKSVRSISHKEYVPTRDCEWSS